MQLVKGMEYTASIAVAETNTARAMGSGDLDVFATPAMVALVENAAMNCVGGMLAEGTTTVGTEIRISHKKATAVGSTVKAKAVLEGIEGRKLLFTVVAWDEAGIVGEGTHTRFIVEVGKFMSKL